MLTQSLFLAELQVVVGLILGAWSYRNIWQTPPHLKGSYGREHVWFLWIGFGVAIVLLVCGGASIGGISLEIAANPPPVGGG